MGALINYIKHVYSRQATWKEVMAFYIVPSSIFGAGAGVGELVGHPEQFHRPYHNSVPLMQADGNVDGNVNGKLEPEEAHKFVHSKRFELDGKGNLTSKGIQDARKFVEAAKEVVPNHVNVVLSTLDAIELKQKANQQK